MADSFLRWRECICNDRISSRVQHRALIPSHEPTKGSASATGRRRPSEGSRESGASTWCGRRVYTSEGRSFTPGAGLCTPPSCGLAPLPWHFGLHDALSSVLIARCHSMPHDTLGQVLMTHFRLLLLSWTAGSMAGISSRHGKSLTYIRRPRRSDADAVHDYCPA